MEIRSSDEIIKLSFECAQAILEKELHIKSIKKEIKEIKENYKEQGISVRTVNKVLNQLKRKAKQDDAELLEEQILMEKFEDNEKIQELISELIAK